MDLQTLIKRCQLGDLDSFEELYRMIGEKAYGTAFLIAGRKGIAEDIVQEAFIQCFKYIKNLRDIATFDAWFYKILIRTGWKMSSAFNDFISVEELDKENSCSEYLTVNYNDRSDLLMLYQAVEKLSAPLKEVVVLYYNNDLSIKKIASITGCLQATVKSRLYKARAQLKKELGNYPEIENRNAFYSKKESVFNGY